MGTKLQISLLFTLVSLSVLGCDPAVIPDHLRDELAKLPQGPVMTPCLGLSPSQCKATPSCAVTTGQALDVDRQCKRERSVTGCTSMNCGDGALTVAVDWFGSRWLFPTTCYPDGWRRDSSSVQAQAMAWTSCPVQSDGADGSSDPQPEPELPADPCAGLSFDACEAKQGCSVVDGTPLDLDAQCQLKNSFAGCTSMDCGDAAFVFAKDDKKNTWMFSVGCFPDGWTQLSQKERPRVKDAFDWSQCPEN